LGQRKPRPEIQYVKYVYGETKEDDVDQFYFHHTFPVVEFAQWMHIMKGRCLTTLQHQIVF